MTFYFHVTNELIPALRPDKTQGSKANLVLILAIGSVLQVRYGDISRIRFSAYTQWMDDPLSILHLFRVHWFPVSLSSHIAILC